MKIQYDLDLCPDTIKVKLPDFIHEEIADTIHSKNDSNYAQVVWDPATHRIKLSVFTKDNFPLDYQTFSKKQI